MERDDSTDVCRRLMAEYEGLQLSRPMRLTRYEPGARLWYDLAPVLPGPAVRAHLEVEKFVGGGFAGQVYRVRILSVTPPGTGADTGVETALRPGAVCAVKIMIPPSRLSLFFRNALYAVGFQGQFQLQTNPAAARCGALWQKFIRAAAACRFGDPACVNDVHATFVDTTLGACGEIGDWVEGRTWRLEVDDRVDLLKKWRKGEIGDDEPGLGSPEYREKYRFMHAFVALLHELGAPEFARQYEWSTCKSQPNCLKRLDRPESPTGGLTAVDFRAGLALLPCLPMSPGDFRLIADGVRRGSLVQFDRGDVGQLRAYLKAHPEVGRMLPETETMLAELEGCEEVYRDSVPDITHNFLRLLCDARLWTRIWESAAGGWRVRNLIDARRERELIANRAKMLLFFLAGLLPFFGKPLRRGWGRADWGSHYRRLLAESGYMARAIRGGTCEHLIAWHRAGRVSGRRALSLLRSPLRFGLHIPLRLLPASLHRFFTDRVFSRNKLHNLFVRPFKLYFNAPLRAQWLRDMVEAGRRKDILSDADAETILSQVDEPYIQKYLVSLVVHIMTLPVTQIVSLTVAGYFYLSHPELSQAERTAAAAGIFALFQVVPVSPGSLCRGLYTTCAAVRNRSFKDYHIALFLSYFKYVGYLAFPIQMTYRYPALARFMAAHWATDAVRLVPVFGEHGALLEHWVFSLSYNRPLTIRRRMARISASRSGLPSRRWHLPLAALAGAGVCIALHVFFRTYTGASPSFGNIWYLRPLFPAMAVIALALGRTVTRYAGGMPRGGRIISAAVAGIMAGALYSLAAFYLELGWMQGIPQLWAPLLWRCFAFALPAALGALITEVAWKQ